MSAADDVNGPRCPVCKERRSFVVEERPQAPVAQNLLFADAEAARNCQAGALRMRRCAACGIVWNEAFRPDLLTYDDSYDNNQAYSDVFTRHLDAVADRIAALAPARPFSLLEVGCGQGDFMRRLKTRLGDRLAAGRGFDPAWRDEAAPVRGLEFHADYFTPSAAQGLATSPDVVVSRHTIEHVADPAAFLADIRSVCETGALIVLETPTVDWILENGVVFDFFYEHCSLFNPNALALLLEGTGFETLSVEPVFEGQYLLAVARAGPTSTPRRSAASSEVEYGDLGYRAHRDRFLETFRSTLRRLAGKGPVALWGGASKGVTLTLLLGEDRDLLACAIDINIRKQGCYMPRSALPIVSPQAALDLGVSAAIVVNPAYLDEVGDYCRRHGLPFQILAADELGDRS